MHRRFCYLAALLCFTMAFQKTTAGYGSVCSKQNCANAEHACDPLDSKCRVQAGATCDKGLAENMKGSLCVSNSKCKGSTKTKCTCNKGFKIKEMENTSKVCEKKKQKSLWLGQAEQRRVGDG